MERFVLGAFGIACFAGAFVSIMLTLYYFFFMLGSVKPDKNRYAHFLGPLLLVMPQMFDEAGNRARKRFAFFALAFAACFGGLAVFHNLSALQP
jgi:hypothetical protein